jgi:predicted metal-dependent hydrolase
LDLLPWVQKNLLPSEIKESTCERKGELKIKFEKERMRATERKMENFLYKKKNWIEKKNWRGRGRVTKRERRSEREGDLKKII